LNLAKPHVIVGVLAFVLTCSAAWPEENTSPYSVGGLAFGDIYYLGSHHLPDADGAAGAVLRRGYLTANADFDNGWFGRLRIELNQDGEFETYDFEADFKDAYVGYKFEDHQLMLGLQPTLTFDVIESVWGLRYLMRTPADLQGAPSRDTGLSLKGRVSEAWSYRVMIGTGEDFGAESGDGESTMAALNWKLSDHWLLDFYFDSEKRPGPNDNTTGQVFAGYETDELRFGAQYLYRDREANSHAELASAFIVKNFGPKLNGIGRIDWVLEPSIRGDNIAYIPFDPRARATMYLAGLEYRVSDHFYLTPNTILISYDRTDEGIRPETDFYLRLTLFADFE
jgi:hypothetical protein